MTRIPFLFWLLFPLSAAQADKRMNPPDSFVSEAQFGLNWLELTSDGLVRVSQGETARRARVESHRTAFQMALAAYALPDLTEVGSSQAGITALTQLTGVIPDGYRISPLSVLRARAGGFKALVLTSQKDPCGEPIFVAIPGTDSGSDAIADLSMGRERRRSPAYQNLLKSLLDIRRSGIKTGEPPRTVHCDHFKIMVTGHSLGGGLAQLLAYDLSAVLGRQQIPGGGRPPLEVEGVTINAFGARDLVSPTASANVANYFLPGDPVSRIGTHIGKTYELRSTLDFPLGAHEAITLAPSAKVELGDRPMSIARHKLDSIRLALRNWGLERAIEATPPKLRQALATQVTSNSTTQVLTSHEAAVPFPSEAELVAAARSIVAEASQRHIALRPDVLELLKSIGLENAAAVAGTPVQPQDPIFRGD